MKRLYLMITTLILTSTVFSQIKYDDGPIITNGFWLLMLQVLLRAQSYKLTAATLTMH